MNILLITIIGFCVLHIIRDLLQIKYGYRHFFTRFLHIWHAPKYEIHGIFVLITVALICLFLLLNQSSSY